MIELSPAQEEFMHQKIFASIAVISPRTGLPHVTTVWAHYQDGKFYVITNKTRAKYKFILAGSTKIGLNLFHPNGFPYLSVNGEAKLVFPEDRSDFWEICLKIIKQYNSGDAVNQWLKRMQDAGDRMLIELEAQNLYTTV